MKIDPIINDDNTLEQITSDLPTSNKRCFTLTASSSLVNGLKFALGAGAWQAVYNKQGITYSENPLLYSSCCLLTGLADSSVTVVIDAVLIGLHSKGFTLDTLKQLIKNWAYYTGVSGLWQPMVDLGAVFGKLIVDSDTSADVCSGLFIFTSYTILYQLMRRCDTSAPYALTAGLAETGFFICGPLTLPSSPAGSRTVLYSMGFSAIGATLGEGSAFFAHKIKRKNHQPLINGITDEKLLIPKLSPLSDDAENPRPRPTPCQCIIL
jgi:hypothetical protein